MSASKIEIIATVIFALAVLHTFLSSQFQKIAGGFPEGSILENLFHMLGEVEVVFGLWAAVLLALIAAVAGRIEAVTYAESLNFTEPMFVFAIMAVAATRPVINFASRIITSAAQLLPLNRETSVFISCLIIGPILGSFITEPAAMTVTALILRDRYFKADVSQKFKYAALGVLFVNISIGGVLTPFAAPPVLMVATKWAWDISFMLQNFGWKAAIAVSINAASVALYLRKELRILKSNPTDSSTTSPPWIIGAHVLFLALVVINAHHAVIFMGIFLLFLGFASITREHQDELLLKQSLLVAFFLGGLVVIGGLQKWWLQPVLTAFSDTALFFGATALTAIADNAALTYLGSQLENVTDGFKYALVAGAITGGGLTVIANAPNPAGFSILQETFGKEGISPLRLLLSALFPTIVALAIFGLFWI